MQFKDGIFDNISINDYHNDTEYLSSSSIKEANKSLKHFEWYFKRDKTRQSFFDFGNAFEIALMDLFNGTKEFDSSVNIFDELQRPETDKTFASSKNKEWKQTFFESSGYIINKSGKESFETIKNMLESCMQDSTIQRLMKDTNYQKSIFWTDPQTKLKLKTRPDVCKINKNVIVDIKTCVDGSPEKFSKDCANYNYPLQAVLQMDGCMRSGLYDKIDNYYWIVVEKEPPFNAQIYCFPHSEWGFFQNKLDYLLCKILLARQQNKYVGYTDRAEDNKDGILEIEIPMWYKA